MRSNDKASPIVMRRNEEISPHIRIIRSDDENSPTFQGRYTDHEKHFNLIQGNATLLLYIIIKWLLRKILQICSPPTMLCVANYADC